VLDILKLDYVGVCLMKADQFILQSAIVQLQCYQLLTDAVRFACNIPRCNLSWRQVKRPRGRVDYSPIFPGTSHSGAPAGFKNVDAQPVGSGASLEMIRNIDNYFAIG